MKVKDIFYLPEEIIRKRGFDCDYTPYKHPLDEYVKIEIDTIQPKGQNSYAKILYNKLEGVSFREDLFVWFNENDKLLTKEDVINIKKQKLEKELEQF